MNDRISALSSAKRTRGRGLAPSAIIRGSVIASCDTVRGFKRQTPHHRTPSKASRNLGVTAGWCDDILRPAVRHPGNALTRSSPRRFKLFVGVAASLAFATLVAVRALDLREERAQLLAAADRRAEGLAAAFDGYL